MSNSRVLKTLLIISCVSLVIILVLIAAPYLSTWLNPSESQTTVGYSDETVRAKVLAIQEEGETKVANVDQIYQVVEIQVLEGEYEQSHMMLEVGKSQILPEDYLLDVGDVVLVNAGKNLVTGESNAYFVDFMREKGIVIIFVLFSAIAFLIGGQTGIRSLAGALVGLLVIYLVIIPQILAGKNPLVVSILGSALFLGLSLYLVYGWNMMTHSAVLGMISSLFLTGLFSIFAVRVARLTGFGDENIMYLMQYSESPLDMRGILLAGIIIGSLGILDDLVVGQSSAVFQLYATDPSMPVKSLYKRAMIIGRDHVAAAVNTLILAYAGESLPMLLLFSLTEVNMRMALNVSYITEEIVKALAGTTGLFLSIPIATFFASYLARYTGKNHPIDTDELHVHAHFSEKKS